MPMLLSLYASFRWARTEGFFLKIGTFIFLASLLSTVVGSSLLALLFGPLPLLSFPFYQLSGERRIILPAPYNYSQRIPSYEIRFLTMEILSLVPQDPVDGSFNGGWVMVQGYRVVFWGSEVGSLPVGSEYRSTLFFLFFVLVNVLGALLGFLISRAQIFQSKKWMAIGSIGRVLLGVVILGVGLWFSTLGEVVRTGPPTGYFYSYDPLRHLGDAFVFALFGITWLAIIVGEMVWRNIVKKPVVSQSR